MAVIVTDAQRKNPALRGWVAAKDAENAGGNTQAQMMASNGAEWHGATPQVQAQLHQANLDIAKQTGQTYNPGAGTYSAPKDTAANTAPPPPKNDAIVGGNGNVGTTTPTGMNLAVSQLPTYVPPASSGLNFDQATNQVKGQIDPMFARALEALKVQQHQDQLNGDQLGTARGGSHSGLAADLQNKVNIGAAGKAADLDATRQTNIAQMAQDLVNRGQDNDFRNKQQALAEYLGLNQLDLQKQGQTADYTGMFGNQQTMQSQNQGFNQKLATDQFGLQQQQQNYNQDPKNPSNVGQNLNNQLTQLQLNDYPAQSQNQAKLVQQQLTAGDLSNKAAQYNFDQLKDPNSPMNKAAALDLQMKQIDASGYSQENKLKLEQLQKTVADIGVPHYKPQTAAEIAQDKVTLATAEKQLADIAKGIYPGDKLTPAAKVITSEEYQPNLKPQYDAHGKLTNAQQLEDQIILSGMSDWEQYKSYKANGIPWTDPIPTMPGK